MRDTRNVEPKRRGVLASVTGTVYAFLKSHRQLDAAAVWVSRRVREAPPSSRLHAVLGPLRARFRGEMTEKDVLAVVRALGAEGIPFWIAGGWGIDLLAGSQARLHDDLDVLLADYERDEPRTCLALASLGYRRIEVLDGLWMTPRSMLDDRAGHQIEVLGLDRARLAQAIGPAEPGSGKPSGLEDYDPPLVTTGTVAGERVPCLSVRLQLLFHTGFDLRGVDGPDIERLRAMSAEQQEQPRH